MMKKVFIVASLTAILLSACSGNAALESATPTAALTETRAPTATKAPTATETPAESPTVSATPVTPIPTNPPDCTNLARFVADATFPDNSPVGAGTAFTKAWTIQNLGTCIWGPDYTLVHYSDERLGAPNSVPLAVTFPGQTVDISVALAAPTNLGSHRSNFVIKNPAGLIMKIDEDSRLWVIINITDTLAVATETPGTGDVSSDSTSVASTATGGAASSGTATGSAFAKVTCAYTTDAAKVAETINAINAYRAQNGLAPYSVNVSLTQAAQAHANDIACNKLFGHNGSNGSTPQTRVASSGYAASSVSENVYGSYPPLTGQQVVTWWINDKTDARHNQNLISTKLTEIGIGYSFYNNFGFYVVVFAAP